jgi:hypothetical protein
MLNTVYYDGKKRREKIGSSVPRLLLLVCFGVERKGTAI